MTGLSTDRCDICDRERPAEAISLYKEWRYCNDNHNDKRCHESVRPFRISIPVAVSLPGDLDIPLNGYPICTELSLTWVADIDVTEVEAHVVEIRAVASETSGASDG